ncbi:mannosyltransferase family protein [Sphaerisporangium aureirubrum]|uniref:Mannosyltransferase family protein n=1 Tax=Sphaerisporangium aureirubrum TaxID=1544736 RepID=A0ABW1NQM7_9ACTN
MQTSPQEAVAVAVAPSPRGRGTATGEAILLWTLSRAGLVIAAAVWIGVLAEDKTSSFLDRWSHWDAKHLVDIAKHGYDGVPGTPPDLGLPAFFPGMPLALRLVHMIVSDWSLAGLLISFVAGTVAMIALARLGELEGPPGTGPRAVLALLLCPTAVFLLAGYSEALFLAFAIPAWLAARRGNWIAAGLLAAGASCVRITGLFLALALIVEFVARRPPARRAPWLLVPFVPLVAYSAYQYSRTGDWLAWQHAQEAGWGRSMTWPWDSFWTTWQMATNDGPFAWPFRMELAGAVLGVVALLWLLAVRRWSEFLYVGLQLGALLLSSYYLSIPRSALLWWPIWILIAQAGVRRRPILWGYALLAGPLMVLNTLTFLSGAWAG